MVKKQEETVKIKILHGSMDYIEGTKSNFTSVILLTAGLRSKGLGGFVFQVHLHATDSQKEVPLQGKQTKKRKEERKRFHKSQT